MLNTVKHSTLSKLRNGDKLFDSSVRGPMSTM